MTLYARTNTSQVAIPGKYGRVLVSDYTSGAMYPVNFKKWAFNLDADDIPNPGFEDSGYKNGLTGLVGSEIQLEGPYQAMRVGGNTPIGTSPAAGMALLIPTALVVYELWLVHPDSVSASSPLAAGLLRYTGVAQVVGDPVESDVTEKASANIKLMTRGVIYLPGTTAPSTAAMLANFVNQLT